jgi:predicted membrane-bound dolichyl-phosphate-mannose-protein mannosyltransferase
MFPLTINDFLLYMAAGLSLMGLLAMLAGIMILVTRVAGKDVRVIANQTAQLAQKGIAEDISGLVGNASSLIDALNQLVRTTSGIGIFLVVVGFLLVLFAFFLVKQIS